MPFRLLREEAEARRTARTVESFHRGKLVAAHPRGFRAHRFTTLAEHMPSSHRRYRDWTHERILRETAAIGDDTAAVVGVMLRSRPHPAQGFRPCIGILRLAGRYDAERLRGLGMTAMAEAFLGLQNHPTAAELSREDWFGLLLSPSDAQLTRYLFRLRIVCELQ